MREKLRQLRKDKKLTQEQLAKKIGISRTYYTNIEKGRYIPSLITANKIKNILGYKNDDIFLD
jgi:putative transcriptional regulator